MTVSFSKSISVLHASIRENARRARLAGDERAAAYWAGREERFQEVLHRANRAALEYAQRWAGVTRTGYHGTKVDGRESGRFEQAGLVVSSWLQGTSRDGDPQDHIHNQIARIVRTVNDGKWRALDTACLRGIIGALQAVAATAVECELTREFGVQWVPRPDGPGNEIKGVTQAQMDAYSTAPSRCTRRNASSPGLGTQARPCAELSASCTTSPRTQLSSHERANPKARSTGTPSPARWDATLGGKLAGIAPAVSNARGPDEPVRQQIAGTRSRFRSASCLRRRGSGWCRRP